MRRLAMLAALAASITTAHPAAAGVVATFQRSWQVMGPAEEIALAPDGKVWVYAHAPARLEVYSTDRTLLRTMNSPNAGAPIELVNYNAHVAFLPNGDAVVADDTRLIRFSPSGDFIKAWPVALNWCNGIAADEAGFVYVTACAPNSSYSIAIIKFDTNSESVVGSWPLTNGGTGLAYSSGTLITAAYGTYPRAEMRSTSGVMVGTFALPYRDLPQAMTADADSRVYLPNVVRNFVTIADFSGAVLGYAGNLAVSPIPEGRMSIPRGVAARGNVLVVSDTGNNRVLEYWITDATPTQTTTWGRLKSLYR